VRHAGAVDVAPRPVGVRPRVLVRQVARRAAPIATLAAVLLAWELWVRLGHVGAYVAPAMSDVMAAMVTKSGTLLDAARVTGTEVVLGYALAAATGLALAIAIVAWRPFERSAYPVLVTSQIVPLAAIAPMIVTWVGFGIGSKVIMVVLISFFPIVVNAVAGLRAIAPEAIHLARSMGAGPWQQLTKIRLPAALPNLFAGLKLAATLAVVGAVLGEFVGADAGLGHTVLIASGSFDTLLVFSALMYLVLMGLGGFYLVVLVERLTIPWHASQRATPEQALRTELFTAERASG
jgi:NitT/TauT family transport system permease protein